MSALRICEKELAVFREELKERMQKYAFSKLIFLENKAGDTLKVVVMPASAQSGKSVDAEHLIQEGFVAGPALSDVSGYTSAE